MRKANEREPGDESQLEHAVHFRRKPRSGRRIALRFVVEDGGARGPAREGVTSNIGVGGAFVVTSDPPPRGTALVVQLAVPPAGETVELRGEVRWIAGPHPAGDKGDPGTNGDADRQRETDAGTDELGMGIHFAPLDEPTHTRLAEYFASLTRTVDHDEGL